MTPLALRSDTLEVTVLPLGAALVGVRFAGRSQNMVLGFADTEDHARVPVYAGAIVGPVANRIWQGRAQIGRATYQMPLNEEGRTTLHSGPDGLHARLWEVTAHTADSLTLTCTLRNGDCGLPGTRVFTARYDLDAHALTLSITATADQPSPINPAAHPYWNLDGAADITGHTLQVNAALYLPTDDMNLPRGAKAPVKDTHFDFTQPKAVPADDRLDVNYCLTGAAPTAVLAGAGGTKLTLTTTAPGLQVYNGAHLPRRSDWQDGPALAPYAAIAMEPQLWPDALRHSHFPSIITTPDRPFHQRTTYTLQPS